MSAIRRRKTGLQRFLDLEHQRSWMQGKTILPDTGKRIESPELRLKYVPRFEKLRRLPQAGEVLTILRRYGRDCRP